MGYSVPLILTNIIMQIEKPSDSSLYVTLGDYTYYFDDSIEGENIVARWHKDDDESDIKEDLQLDNLLIKSNNQ
jgi:hypothetical protein